MIFTHWILRETRNVA